MLRKLSLVLLILSTLALPLGKKALAQNPSATEIGVAPAIVEIAANPGEAVSRELVVFNGTKTNLPISLSHKSLLTTEDIIDATSINDFDASRWISFDREAYLFQPKESIKIPFSINIPADATPGGHYAQVNIRGLTVEQSRGLLNGGIIVPEIGVSVLINVAGDINEKLETIPTGLFPIYSRPDTSNIMQLKVQNTGNTHVLVEPKITMRTFGYTFEKTLSPRLILPNTKKSISEEWETPSRLGIYIADVSYRYGNQGVVSHSHKEIVIVMPDILLTIFITGFGIAGYYIYVKRNNFNKAVAVLLNKNKNKK